MELITSFDNLLSPLKNNKYLNSFLVIFLFIVAEYYLPYRIIPKNIINFYKSSKIISTILIFLLSYTVSKDIYVSIVITIIILSLCYVSYYMDNNNKEKFNNNKKDHINYDHNHNNNHENNDDNTYNFTKNNLRYLNL